MTQKEAIIKALEKLGGKAKMSEICKLAKSIGDFSGSNDASATIRNCIYKHPQDFLSSEQKDYWQLVSYQEEIACRDRRIKELEEENSRLKVKKTEDDFVKRLVRETKHLYKHEKDKIEVIRQILYKVGRNDAEEELDAWIEGREYKSSINVSGDYVVTKHVDNEVNGVAFGGTGISVN